MPSVLTSLHPSIAHNHVIRLRGWLIYKPRTTDNPKIQRSGGVELVQRQLIASFSPNQDVRNHRWRGPRYARIDMGDEELH